jgi:hypothetical protein
VSQPKQVDPFCVVEPQGAGQGIEHAGRHPSQGAALQPGVVLHTHPGQLRDLATTQAGHPPPPRRRQAGLLRADLGATGGEELADLGSIVHDLDITTPTSR